MNLWTMIVLVVLIGSITGVLTERYRALGKTGGKLAQEDRRALEEDRNAARAEIQELRERVKVLERIATDPSRRTAEEIEKLRDER